MEKNRCNLDVGSCIQGISIKMIEKQAYFYYKGRVMDNKHNKKCATCDRMV